MADTSITSHLGEQRFFAGLEPEFLEFLAECARERHFGTNALVIRHEDHATNFFLVRQGRISREVPAIQGPPLIMQSIGAGEVLGWSWLIPPYRWSFMARAEQPTDVFEFDSRRIFERCEADPRFGYELLQRFAALMSERLSHARRKMVEEWYPLGFG